MSLFSPTYNEKTSKNVDKTTKQEESTYVLGILTDNCTQIKAIVKFKSYRFW